MLVLISQIPDRIQLLQYEREEDTMRLLDSIAVDSKLADTCLKSRENV